MTALFVTAFLVGLSGAMMPGPLTTVAIVHTRSHGFWSGPLSTLGHALLEAFMVALLAYGAGEILARDPVAGTVAVLGAAILAWMGVGMIRAARAQGISPNPETTRSVHGGAPFPTRHPFLAALGATLSNPYWLLWWATVGAGYVALAQTFGPRGVVVFYSGHILSDLVWLTLLSGAFTGGARLLSERAMSWIVGSLGVFLMGLAAYFLYAGVRFLT